MLPSPSSRLKSPSRESDSDEEPVRSVSPAPWVVNEEIHKSTNAIFMKRLCRAHNSCSRCDFEYLPSPNSKYAKRLEHKIKSSHLTGSKHSAPTALAKEEKKPEIKKEKRDVIETKTSDAQITSSLLGSSHYTPAYGIDRLRTGYPFMHDPTPALRQLSEYAKPHLGANHDVTRPILPGLQSPTMLDPYYRVPEVFSPTGRDKTETGLDKREVDIKSRELWDAEMKERLKQEAELKPTAVDRLSSRTGNSTEISPWLEFQRRYSALAGSGMMGGLYPAPGLTAPELLQREREYLEQLANLGAVPVPPLSLEQSLLAERIAAERLALTADPMARLQMSTGSIAPVTAAIGGSSGPRLAHPTYPLTTSQLLVAAREQELFYRELLSQPPYSTDPVLAHQLMIQALAQQDAIQRQLTLEREGITSGLAGSLYP